MDAWKVYLLLGVWTCAICNHAVSSCGCYGPGPSPDDCVCQMLNRGEIPQYVRKFTTAPETVPTAPTLHPQFTFYPLSGTFEEGVPVVLSCNIGYANMIDQFIVWEHNGTIVDPSTEHTGIYMEQDDMTYNSTLTVPRFSASDQGDYVCRVGSGINSITSPAATLQLPKFLGWIDRAYPTPTHADTVILTVQKGGSVLLECSPNTTVLVDGQAPLWSKGESATPLLLLLLPSGNVLIRDVLDDTNLTCVWAPEHAESRRQFQVIVSSDPPTQDQLTLVVRPRDTTVAAGSSLELYCIANIDASSIQWFRDGHEVDDKVIIMGDGQVLVINGATASDSGSYTCVVSRQLTSVNASATVSIVDLPDNATLSVFTDGIHSDSEDIIPAVTTNISLLCHVDTSTALYYQWLHSGVVIEEGLDKDTLFIDTSEGGTVTGSYQCFVSNVAGQISSNAIWISTAKPYPPTGVKIRRNTSPHVYFQYDIHWTKPEQHGWSITNYTVQTLALLDGTAAHFCSCVDHRSDESVTVFNFQAGCPGSSLALDHYLYYRVAVNTVAAGQSAFMSGHPITITAGPPPSATSVAVESKTVNQSTHQWDIALTWTSQDTDVYNTACYDTCITSPCSTTMCHRVKPPFKVSINCCTTCEWTVKNSNLLYGERFSVYSENISTPAIKPSAPPQLLSVEHLGTVGTHYSISFKLPDDSMSCMCGNVDSFNVTVHTNDLSIQPVTQSLPLVRKNKTFSVSISIPGAHCSTPYNISMAFNNSEGMSDFSAAIPIGLPTGSNIPTFANRQLYYTNSSSSKVMVYYELQPGARCLLEDRLLQSRICYISSTEEECLASAVIGNRNTICISINAEHGNITLPRYHNFCLVAEISSTVLDFNSAYKILRVPANEGIPASKPSSFSVRVVDEYVEIRWEAPPLDSWNGIPESYSLNTSVNGRLVNSTRISVQADLNEYRVYQSYDSMTTYNITLSSCTSIGCGPIASSSIQNNPQQVTSQPSTSSDSGVDPVLASTVPSGVAVFSLFVVALFAISCLCYRRRRKRAYDELRNVSEADFPITLPRAHEPLQRHLEPPTGILAAPSEYTEFESLCSVSHVGEWVEQQAVHRDGYMKDVEEELEHIQEVQVRDKSQSTSSGGPVSLSRAPERNSDYCSETEAVLQSGSNRPTDSTIPTTSTASAAAAAVYSSGYSTEQSLSHLQTNTFPILPKQRNSTQLQTAYNGTHKPSTATVNHVSTTGYHVPSNTKSLTNDDVATTDFISSLLCHEDFNPQDPTTDTCKDTAFSPILATGTHLEASEPLPLPTTNPYISSTAGSTYNVMCTRPVTSGRPPEPGDPEEETDSVFDNSIPPLTPSTANPPQCRTRSSITSGFCSLSNTSLDSNDNMEMAPIHSKQYSSNTQSSVQVLTTPWAKCPISTAVPVIPSLLPSQHRPSIHQPSLQGAAMPCYENVDNDPLAHENIRFEP